MTFDSIDAVLVYLVAQLGGNKAVGPAIWPTKDPDVAARQLANCLNADRPERLRPDQLLYSLRLARDAGHHEGMAYLCADLGYAPTTPVDPPDVRAELQREFIAAQARMSEMLARLERLGGTL